MDNDDQKVFDVAKPGAGEPSNTSRPVIVGHKNMIDDPMVKAAASATLDGDKDDEETTDPTKVKKEAAEGLGPHQAKAVEPPGGSPKAEADETTKSDTAPAEPTETSPTETEPAKEPAVTDSLPDETDTPKPKEKEAAINQEEQVQQAAIQKLIEGKQYVVHVGEPQHHKNRRLLLIITAVVVIAIAGFVAYLLK